MTLRRRRPHPRIAALRTLPRFSQLSDHELGRMASTFDEVHVPAGAVLTREGRVARECYLIVEGEADVRVGSKLIAHLGPGEFVGEMALLSGGSRSATVEATTPMHLLTVHQRGFWSVLDDPAVARTVLRQMTERLRRADGAAAEAGTSIEESAR